MDTEKFRVHQGIKIVLSKIETGYTDEIHTKKESKKQLVKNIRKMSELQEKLYAHNKYSLLIIFQAMDAAGKDSAIKHVMSGLNPQGTQVFSFKQPSTEELDHDYLWRTNKALPERGRIGIFNRSYYEEVLIVRVRNLLKVQKIPALRITENIWKERFTQINNLERYLFENGTYILKFFLNVSKREQAKRFLKRIEDPAKNWKFSESDLAERDYWNDYMKSYEEAINATSTDYAPWHIIPADKKWFTRLAISEIIIETLNSMDIKYPEVSEEQKKNLEACKAELLKQDS
ncbi:MAG: polyphosphate--nucleotide phosphotransferase [Ignavibacteriae bacterium HGW-Ignavibacteriae-3]|nr:MAG: polyphosphate--nucleotide phosphotransferase [Ignavibacteriae bacterium HGW-Ignavibacteriae-3]